MVCFLLGSMQTVLDHPFNEPHTKVKADVDQPSKGCGCLWQAQHSVKSVQWVESLWRQSNRYPRETWRVKFLLKMPLYDHQWHHLELLRWILSPTFYFIISVGIVSYSQGDEYTHTKGGRSWFPETNSLTSVHTENSCVGDMKPES